MVLVTLVPAIVVGLQYETMGTSAQIGLSIVANALTLVCLLFAHVASPALRLNVETPAGRPLRRSLRALAVYGVSVLATSAVGFYAYADPVAGQAGPTPAAAAAYDVAHGWWHVLQAQALSMLAAGLTSLGAQTDTATVPLPERRAIAVQAIVLAGVVVLLVTRTIRVVEASLAFSTLAAAAHAAIARVRLRRPPAMRDGPQV